MRVYQILKPLVEVGLDELMKSQRKQKMDPITHTIIAVGCLFIAYKVGRYTAHKEFDKFLKVLQEVQKTAKKPDPFFTRD